MESKIEITTTVKKQKDLTEQYGIDEAEMNTNENFKRVRCASHLASELGSLLKKYDKENGICAETTLQDIISWAVNNKVIEIDPEVK